MSSQVEQPQSHQSSGGSLSTASSPSNSISLIKLDELSSFGATKSGRLPALIQMVPGSQQVATEAHSMPAIDADQLERQQQQQQQQAASLPVQQQQLEADKENAELGDDFQMVQMESSELMVGPSLPQAPVPDGMGSELGKQQAAPQAVGGGQQAEISKERAALLSSLQNAQQQPASHLGDSLIDMIVNLRNENQNLVRALETNNEYVKDRISEFKRLNEDAKRREAQFAMDKADFEHQQRKLQRQNQVLSERLKSMEAKLSNMKLEVSDSLAAAHSSKASSVREPDQQLYPELSADSFLNSALNNQDQNQTTTMQMDATSQELLNGSSSSASSSSSSSAPSAPMETDHQHQQQQPSTSAEAAKIANMSKEELSKHFDSTKAQFYAMDDPMKQCDQLEAQLNDIGKRDYEICLLQQQLNIYRQDFRLERMANLEAKLQIERLKADIDRLCLDRMGRGDEETSPKHHHGHRHLHRGCHHRRSGSQSGPQVRFEAAADAAIGLSSKLTHHLTKKAARQAAKAAKYAAKQAHRDEKAAAYAATAAASAEPSAPSEHHQHHRRQSGLRAVRNEVVSDLLSTANKAMLTGYKMASTHVNLALDKLSAFEQEQAKNLAANKQQQDNVAKPSGPPSVD